LSDLTDIDSSKEFEWLIRRRAPGAGRIFAPPAGWVGVVSGANLKLERNSLDHGGQLDNPQPAV